jgi:hypothetical protein
MRPAPIVPIPKVKHSLIEQRFSRMPRNRANAATAENVEFKPVKVKPSSRRRIRAGHPWYRMKRLPDSRFSIKHMDDDLRAK